MITTIILARMGSKRLRIKNFLRFNGKPLLEWTIEEALNSKYIDRIIISTDYEWYSFDHPLVEINHRSVELSQDHITPDEVIKSLREERKIEGTIILLQPTSPLRTYKHINEAIELFWKEKKTVISVNKYTYKPNGAIYIYDTENVYDGPFCFYEMEPRESIDIDYQYEFKMAESLQLEIKKERELEILLNQIRWNDG